MAQLIKHWVMSCEQGIRESRVDDRLTRPALREPSEQITALEGTMQIDLVPEIPPSGDFQNIVAAMDKFCSFLFANPTSRREAKR